MWLRGEGLDAVRRDPSMAGALASPRLAEPLRRVQRDHNEVFGGSVASEPEQLTQLVADAAPGQPASRRCSGWASPARWTAADRYPSCGGSAPRWSTAPRRTGRSRWPVPLLDEAHLEIRSTPHTRTAAESLVEALLLRVVSHFRPGLVALHVWDVGQLTGAVPGLYPLTRTGLLTVHDPGRLEELLEELSDHIRRIHTRVLVDGHPSLRALAETTGGRSEPWQIAVLVGNNAELRDEDRPRPAAGRPQRPGLRHPARARRRAGDDQRTHGDGGAAGAGRPRRPDHRPRHDERAARHGHPGPAAAP